MHPPALLVHGGAGREQPELAAAQHAGCAQAVDAGWQVLAGGGGAVEAVTAAVQTLEDLPVFNAGVGSSLTSDGTVEMDASIMDGTRLAAGAVGAVSGVCNPVRVARAIMDEGRHVVLAGAGAEAFARARKLPTAPPEHFITARQRQRWLAALGADGGTVGAVAVDAVGHVAAATSTGGLMHKQPGRIGDSAIVGAGTYADDRAGAASATGHGEGIMLLSLSKAAVDGLRDGSHPAAVARLVIRVITERLQCDAGIILVDRFGRIGFARNTERMLIGYRTASRGPTTGDGSA